MDDHFLSSLINEVENSMSAIGLHMIDTDLAVLPINDEDEFDSKNLNENELIEFAKNDKIKIYMSTIFVSSDSTWSDRVLNPDLYKINKEFKLVAPTEFEVELESLKDIVDNWEDED